jgi:hypothetical protein
MVDRLLALKRSLDEVQRGAWGAAEPFGSALRDSLQRGLNARQNKPAELIAKWLDGRLRAGGSKGLSEGELEAALEAALVLFRAIQVGVGGGEGDGSLRHRPYSYCNPWASIFVVGGTSHVREHAGGGGGGGGAGTPCTLSAPLPTPTTTHVLFYSTLRAVLTPPTHLVLLLPGCRARTSLRPSTSVTWPSGCCWGGPRPWRRRRA